MSMGGGGSKKGGMPQIPSEATRLANPITFYKQTTGKYPNNAEIWWSMKRPPEVGTDRPPKQYLEVFDPGMRHQMTFGNSLAPKGHFLLKAFHQDRSSVSSVPNLPIKSAGGFRPTSVAFYAGRVFYSGPFTADYNTKIYFTQILERPEQVNRCYQDLDPTSEDIRDLLASDGGVIVIPEITQIIHMVSFGFDLFVFADNGVWRIAGSDGVGFRANDFSVTKLSGTPAISNMSFVLVDGVPIWWNRSGIHTLLPGENGVQVQSLTDQTIKTFFEKIPEQSKFYAKGSYDPLKKRVEWLYRSEETEVFSELFSYDKILLLDVRVGSWSPWSFPDFNRVEVKGIFALEGEAQNQAVERVVVGEDLVVSGLDNVYSIRDFITIVESRFKYIVNVLPEQSVPPIPPVPSEPEPVFVSDARVMVNTDEVVIYQ